MLSNLWSDIKLLFEVFFSAILFAVVPVALFFYILIYGFIDIGKEIYNTNNSNATNTQIVDYDGYIQNTFYQNVNKNTQTYNEKEDNTDYITEKDIQNYKQTTEYIPGKTNPFAN